MAAQETKIELMRQYPIPKTPEEVNKYSFMGYGLFGILIVAVTALTLYFSK
jgi:hypothetical protein